MQNRWNILFAQTYEDIDGLEQDLTPLLMHWSCIFFCTNASIW